MKSKRFFSIISLALALTLAGVSTIAVMAQESEPDPPELTYLVQEGDTAESVLQFIFDEYGLSLTIEELLAANGLTSEEELVAEVILVIPQPEAEEPTPEVEEPTPTETEEPEPEAEEPTPEVEEPTPEAQDPTPEVEEPTPTETEEPEPEAEDPTEELTPVAPTEPPQGRTAEPAEEPLAAPAEIGVAAIDPGKGSSKVYIMDTSGTGAAVHVDFYPPNSTTPAVQKDYTLNGYGSEEIDTKDTGLGDGFRGTAIIQSDSKVASAAFSEWSNSTRGGAYTGFTEASKIQFMPFINYQPNVRDWSLAVFNVGDSDTTITLTYFNRAGEQDFVLQDSIPAGNQGYYDSVLGGPGVPNWTDSSYFNSRGFWTGGVKIEADGADDLITAVMSSHYESFSAQYGGVNSGDDAVYVPYVARRQDSDRGRIAESNVSIQNLSDSETEVTTSFVDNQTGAVSLQIKDTIPAFSIASFNIMVGGATHPRGDFYSLDRFPPADSGYDEWVGSAIITSDNNAELAVVVTTIRNEDDSMGQYAAGGQSVASSECFFPAGFRIENGNFDTQGKFNQIRLQNPSTTNAATDVDIRWYSHSGSETAIAGTTNMTIAAEKSKAILSKQPSISGLGNTWTGGIRVTSDEPLLCVTDVLNGQIRMSTFEGNISQ
jgi:outer membrane biosynthesis protein TonB